MKSMVIQSQRRFELAEREIPAQGEHEVQVPVMASGICGTDVHIFRGEYLGDYPVTPGHEFSGVETATGKEVRRFQPGDQMAVEPNIACDNCRECLSNRKNSYRNWQAAGATLPDGMEQSGTVPEKAAFDTGLLPFEQAAFMEPRSCVVHGLERIVIEPGDRMAILGAGPIGNLLMQLAHRKGAGEITMLEELPETLAMIERGDPTVKKVMMMPNSEQVSEDRGQPVGRLFVCQIMMVQQKKTGAEEIRPKGGKAKGNRTNHPCSMVHS